MTACRIEQAHHHHRRCGLSAAGFPDEANAFPALDLKTDAINRAEYLALWKFILAPEQGCQRAAHTLARIFLDEARDAQKRLAFVRGFCRRKNRRHHALWQKVAQIG